MFFHALSSDYLTFTMARMSCAPILLECFIGFRNAILHDSFWCNFDGAFLQIDGLFLDIEIVRSGKPLTGGFWCALPDSNRQPTV